jgi:hypothetical protein
MLANALSRTGDRFLESKLTESRDKRLAEQRGAEKAEDREWQEAQAIRRDGMERARLEFASELRQEESDRQIEPGFTVDGERVTKGGLISAIGGDKEIVDIKQASKESDRAAKFENDKELKRMELDIRAAKKKDMGATGGQKLDAMTKAYKIIYGEDGEIPGQVAVDAANQIYKAIGLPPYGGPTLESEEEGDLIQQQVDEEWDDQDSMFSNKVDGLTETAWKRKRLKELQSGESASTSTKTGDEQPDKTYNTQADLAAAIKSGEITKAQARAIYEKQFGST